MPLHSSLVTEPNSVSTNKQQTNTPVASLVSAQSDAQFCAQNPEPLWCRHMRESSGQQVAKKHGKSIISGLDSTVPYSIVPHSFPWLEEGVPHSLALPR